MQLSNGRLAHLHPVDRALAGPETRCRRLGEGGTRVEGRLAEPPLCTQLDAIMLLVSAGLLPLHVATLPPSLQQTNQPKTVLDLELEMCLSLLHSPIG